MHESDEDKILSILKKAKGKPMKTSDVYRELKKSYEYSKSKKTVHRKLNKLEKIGSIVDTSHPSVRQHLWILKYYSEKKIKQLNLNFDPIIKVLMIDINRLEKFFDPMTPPKIKIPGISLHFEKKTSYSLFKEHIENLLEIDPSLFKNPFKEMEKLKRDELNFYKLRRKVTCEIESIIKKNYPEMTEERKSGLIMLFSSRLKSDYVGKNYSLMKNSADSKKNFNEENEILLGEINKSNPKALEEILNSDVFKFLIKETHEDNIDERLLKKMKESHQINKETIEELWLKASVAQKRIDNLVSFVEIFPDIKASY
mgnify:CR=1 FL=1